MIPYKKFWCPYPPRPAATIPPTRMGEFEGWWAQRKFNGTRTLAFLGPGGDVILRTRHRDEHRAYKLTDAMTQSLLDIGLDRSAWHVLDGELLHNKTTRVKDRFVIFDLLVHNGSYLVGTTVADRRQRLYLALGEPGLRETETGHGIAIEVGTTVWVAETFADPRNFPQLYEQALKLDELEGLVLKNPSGVLSHGASDNNNGEWMVRVRKPHPNYAY